MTDILKIREGYHWFRHHEDGSTFVALMQGEFWYMPGVGVPILPLAVKATATYLQPVEAPAASGLN